MLKSFQGYRTYLYNLLMLLIAVAGIALQYLGQLGLSEQQAGYAGMGLTMFVTVGNFYLRSITSTAPGQKE